MGRVGLRRGGATRIFFAADIHGSEPTWRKFINAASFYDVDVLVFGGDLMGKVLVPIVLERGIYRARFQEEAHTFEADGLEPLTISLERAGYYWKVMDRETYGAAKTDPAMQRGLFIELARARLATWLEAAEERLRGTGVHLYVTGGNDDEPSVLEVLEHHEGERVVACEGLLVDLDGKHSMVTVGLSTPTPWDTPREASEEEIEAVIDRALSVLADPGRCIFNFHCPPKDTPIDTCLRLERDPLRPDELPKPVRVGGRFATTGGGSMAVREAIERHQPAAALHGHIHEAGGSIRLGRTRCFNPGSEYGQGSLQGWVLAVRDGRVTGHQHTSG